jgi:hypothetical protein
MIKRHCILLHGLTLAAACGLPLLPAGLSADPKPVALKHTPPSPASYWQVDDVRPGMKGQGRTVVKGTRIENFDAEVLGVLKNTSPGRDMVLCRLSGLNLEKTGVIAGMSGSPVFIDGKLLGAVAYAWAYGKEPIAGVTPFCQMHSYVESFERRDLAEQSKLGPIGLNRPVRIGEHDYDSVTVAQGFDAPSRQAEDTLLMVPLRTPLAATGFSATSLAMLRDGFSGGGLGGMVPMQTGGTPARVADEEKDVTLQPGGALAVTLVRGDFDLTGIGTVTHIEGDRVYGWGHPFMSIGSCDLPLMTGYIHTIYPRQSVSFKLGSPLRTVGVINADVSTGIAGWLNRTPDMLPMKMTVVRNDSETRTFQVELARQKSLLPNLVFTCLLNSIDMEGDLPDEMTAELEARFEIEGHETIVLHDTFSGASYSGNRAPTSLYSPISVITSLLNQNPYQPLRIKRIECKTRVVPGRRTAEVESIEPVSETYAPGETVQLSAFVRPYRGARQKLTLSLKLPDDMPEGPCAVIVCDDLANARLEIRDNPVLSNPQSTEQVLETIKFQTAVRRTNLVVRIPLRETGVALDGKALPHLPAGMVQVLGNTRRGSAQTMSSALVARQSTDWIFSGTDTTRITVSKNKKLLPRD